ncbi:MAG: type II toxin-antitoxin system RelE/ParE family toxin [Bacteroidales bacterium]|nr:type II toxin-antitoxin system RelE/ParE family toxin [Bacteroidales bacterium]
MDERLSHTDSNLLFAISKDFFLMRVGDYRIIYRVEEGKITILIVKIDVNGIIL